MKKIAFKALFVLLLTAFSSSAVMAQRGAPQFPEFHFFTMSFGGGYSSLFTNVEGAKVAGGGGATFGLGYEYVYRAFWLSLGVEGQYLSSFMKPDLQNLEVPMFDTEGDPFTMTYRFDNWQDVTQAAYFNIPFMLGFNAGPVYAGVGAKFGLNLWGVGESKVKYTTSAQYDQFIGSFEGMPDHWLGEQVSEPIGGKPSKLAFNPNVAIIAEVGAEIYSQERTKKVLPFRMKLGLYGEYGFTNANKNATDANPFVFGDPNPVILNTTSYLTSASMQGKSVNPFYIGAKLTLMFEMPVPQKCNCLQDSRGASWRNNAPKATRKLKKKTDRIQKDEQKK